MKRKIAVSVPEELVAEVQREVREGRAPSVSAYVTEALRHRAKKDTLDDLLDEMDREYGPPSAEAVAWAEVVTRRADEYWTRVRSSRSSAGTSGSVPTDAADIRRLDPELPIAEI